MVSLAHARARRLEALRASVADAAREAVAGLDPPPGVLLFGSLATGAFEGGSDVDLLVVGPDRLDRRPFLRRSLPVDIVRIDRAAFGTDGTRSPLVRRALAEGTWLVPLTP
ncbi:nucleotidyltransferase domain-containing protein [Roseospira navarrensis]|uniref:Polymerase nucleotidyl transferase domain-containing protein n=1 Tax=Roseospira navarrensis TaxID=140058 RepID=A0A7X1ZF35_9PROT|nr:nucleotidyltransferase domain-containing protein [Roseospira navarrensis]MQX37400.1 hypothetical protein [Roseospira navarrensis]